MTSSRDQFVDGGLNATLIRLGGMKFSYSFADEEVILSQESA